MAGEWLKLEANTPEKPEVFAITVAMGWEDPDLAVGKLFKVWRWFDQQTVDGNAPNVTLALLDRVSGVSGFAQAMCDAGWLVQASGALSLPNFDRHNGKTAKDRALTAKRVAKHKSNAACNAENVTSALPREENSREELKTTTADAVVAASKPGVSSAGTDRKDCPHKEIVALYHEILPQCPRVRDWTPARANHLRARWNENKGRQSLEYWRRYFEYVATCPFLVGATNAPAGRKPFFADLEWLVTSANFTKVREQKYEQ